MNRFNNKRNKLTEPNSITGSLSVNPEGDPRKHNNEDARNVDLDKEVAGVALQVKVYLKQGELS